MTQETAYLLAGDIGGTKTNLAVYGTKDDLRQPLVEATLPSSDYPNLETLVETFLDRCFRQHNLTVNRASFGVAGPVVGGQATMTNLPWVMQDEALATNLNLSAVYLLNDLEAIANGIPILEPEDVYTLNAGRVVSGGTMAVIAPGTGLGEAFLTWDGQTYRAHPSEGGHADFAPNTDLQMKLLSYLIERFGHVSYERVCSGLGLPNIYNFLKDGADAPELPWLAEKLAQVKDPTPLIVNTALEKDSPCQLCRMTVDLFIDILAAQAGNLALTVLAFSGVYLGGGILPRLLSILTPEKFMVGFQHKGRFSDLLRQIPVNLIRNPKVALLGAAWYGLQRKLSFGTTM